MMLSVDIRGMNEVQSALRNLASEQMPYAMMTAINTTAFAVRKASADRLKSVFDRPTPLIQGATSVIKATKTDLVATVAIDPKRAPVLQLHEEGGLRKSDQRMERYLRSKGWLPAGWRAIPTDSMPKDSYGNPKQSDVVKIIAALPVIGGIKGDARRCFVTKGRPGLGAGIYRQASRSQGMKVIKLYHFEPQAKYRPRLNWERTVIDEARRVFPDAMESAVRRAIETAR